MTTKGHRDTIEVRIKKRNSMNRVNGQQEGYIEDALDYFLSGVPVTEIAITYGVTKGAIYNGLARAALYRLMVLHQKERLEQLSEIKGADK